MIENEGGKVTTYSRFKLLVIMCLSLVVAEGEVLNWKGPYKARKLCQQALSVPDGYLFV